MRRALVKRASPPGAAPVDRRVEVVRVAPAPPRATSRNDVLRSPALADVGATSAAGDTVSAGEREAGRDLGRRRGPRKRTSPARLPVNAAR